ncbi:hypothetical protein [Dethiobacter alkaliphilus]|uniref:hypothetical protein n=1 Tax=Dethiobacter alkaliphilus TaxID=427926 RepID=UPI002226E4C3|nr:hypothetical protein [Dethiobacter alkaliphilus]MCW3489966.1 hypothetical protein [Dethiobacter alkaliphilus]
MRLLFEDRLFRGFIAGLIGGVIMNIYGTVSWLLGFSQIPFWQWASIIILGRPEVQGVGQHAIGLIGHLVFTGILGVLFAYFLPAVSSKLYLFKGWLYGVAIWFFIYSISHLFEVEGTFPIQLRTATSNVIGASIWGIVLAWALAWLDKKRKIG